MTVFLKELTNIFPIIVLIEVLARRKV